MTQSLWAAALAVPLALHGQGGACDSAGAATRDTIRRTIVGRNQNAELTIDYAHPAVLGRLIFGGVIPRGRPWCVGGNPPARFSTTAPIELAGIRLERGTYSLWIIADSDSVVLVISRKFDAASTPYDQSGDVGRARIVGGPEPGVVEEFGMRIIVARTGSDTLVSTYERTKSAQRRMDVSSIAIIPPPTTATLVIEWDRFRWSAPITVM